MARAIQPFHTIYDGDVLYMITTGQVDDKKIDPASLGIVAADVAWDAILLSFD
jgi:L-aminopeptidase/D-esterase-like protein